MLEKRGIDICNIESTSQNGHNLRFKADPLSTIGPFVQFALLGRTFILAADQMIYNEGDAATCLYKVVSGGVRLYKVNRAGRRQVMRFVVPGGYFGLESFETHSLAADALCATTLVRCNRAEIETLGDDDREIHEKLLLIARCSLVDMQEQLVMLGRRTARERSASFLFQVHRTSRCKAGTTIDLPMSRQDIGDYLGLTVETVCREFSALRRKSIIATPARHQVIIKNVDALAAFSHGDRR